MTHAEAVTLRCARPDDAAALARLAALDSALPLTAPVLLAQVDGRRPLAAISLADGAVIADPFAPTAALVELLRTRERQLAGGPAAPRRRRARGWVRRRVPALG